MPVFFWKLSRVGCVEVLSSTSMYACQFDQFTTLSVSEWSAQVGFADPLAPALLLFVPLVPQAASAAARPTAPVPCISVRRVSRPRTSEGSRFLGRFSV